ncbi:nuclear apoptosis-inducing factor 1-like [Chiloscyllium plagiosum]|uniref:nuclear apoptosis-inducing factor 1-like n=1 Tax=Chiloscyllium plagiosum TaxID=36176 RepID=UPI001CB885E7|nr:nuclear apoptosis-inducing factor 1-like [Chiloscyllium plagiosum]
MAQEDAFRRRKLNFNEDETEILIREVTLHQDQLFGRGETKLPPGTKNKVWLSILAKVNAVSKCTRDIGDIKKRWYDMCHRTKDKVIKLAQEALRSERAVTGTPPPRRQEEEEEEEEEEDKPTSVSLGHHPAGPGTSGGEDGAEPSTSGASQDGSTGTASSRHAAPSQQTKTPVLPLQVAWHGRQVPPMLSHQSGVQWPPVLLFTLGQNATRISTQDRPPDYQAGNSFDETTVKVKQEDISPNFDADYSSPDIASPPNLQEQSSFRPQGKRLHKQISDEEFFGIQEQHNVLLGDGNKELHGIRQELRELRSDLQELAAGIRQPLDRLADYIQALLPLLQHPPRSRMMEMTDSFTQPDEEETMGSGSSLSQSRRTGCKTCKRPKLGM